MKNINLKAIGIFTLSILLFGFIVSCSNENIEKLSFVSDSNIQNIEETIMKDETMIEDKETINDKLGVYTDYSPEAVKNASGNIVLFFHADWCPTCISIEKDVLSKEIPSDLTILKVDYDTATELKQKYSVLTQSSFVQVDNEGNMIKRWISGRGLDDIVKKVQ